MLSPDGSKMVYAAHNNNSPRQLWVRRTDSFSAQRLDGTDGASFPFWSPDSRLVGFFADGKVKKIPAAGGPVSVIAEAGNPRGASWGPNDVILVSPDFQGPIARVSAAGGPLVPVTTLQGSKHTTHRWPWFLPDGKHFLYLAANHNGGNAAENGVYYASLDGKENHLVIASDSAAEYANGDLLFHAQSALVAQPFDASSGKLTGEPVTLVDKVLYDLGIWRTTASTSQNGMLLYQASSTDLLGAQLVWYDVTGKNMTPLTERGPFIDPRISPDGTKIAVSYGDPSRQIWIIDAARGSKTRLTFDESVKNAPSWSPDGKIVLYQATATTAAHGSTETQIWTKPANGSGAGQRVAITSAQATSYPAWSPDGKYIAYLSAEGPTGGSIVATEFGGDHKPFVVVAPASPQANIQSLSISPTGRWIAYTSTESGRGNVYVTGFPHGTGKWQVSIDLGDFPTWRADGKKLYFIRYSDDIIYECDVDERDGDLQIGPPKPLFKATISAQGRGFDVAPDGKRFLIDEAQQDASTPLSLVVNWPAELKKR
jgi:eukaryotic-like serine/threonine-protein kinase